MSLHGANALSSESWVGSNSSPMLNLSDSPDPIMFVCAKCGLEFDGNTATISDFDDSVQCPNCGNWE
jgi:hypothetical protein